MLKIPISDINKEAYLFQILPNIQRSSILVSQGLTS